MNIVPPFIPNSDDDMHCVSAVFRMVLKHFQNEDMTWKQIDTITKTIPGKGVWTVPGDIMLTKRGITVINIEPIDYEALYKEGVTYLTKIFGEQTATYYLERSNIAAVIPDIPEFIELVRHETRRANVEEIAHWIKLGNLVGVTINSTILNNKLGFALHYVLVYNFDGTHFHLHDPGLPPVPSRKVMMDEFEKSFVYPGGNGGIEVFSLKGFTGV
ncbi:MAG TPA: hypothetical protein VJB96_03630 [Patescibacteria group bacterium]|nr:hypothetical protein [Patescibacteria group bacterium]